MKKLTTAALATMVVAGSVLVVPAPAAEAHTACSATSIRINATAGAERPTTVSGHSHATGKHYLSHIHNGVWYWYADNDNGRSDKWDTYFGMQAC